MDGVEQIDISVKCDYRSSRAILYFLAWFLAAIPTLEGTANLHCQLSRSNLYGGSREDDDFYCGAPLGWYVYRHSS